MARSNLGKATLAILLAWLSPARATAREASEGEDHVEARSYGTKRETEPPRYVRSLGDAGIPALESAYWLDVGLDFRTRYELRKGDFRREAAVLDTPVLLRTRAYLGLKEIVDPFRFTLEVEDARRYGSQFPRDSRDVNEVEPIQAFLELYFAHALGRNRPLSLKTGRMAFELLDRRLVARNEWRNTTNTFQGVRLTLGQPRNDWQLDLMALQPLQLLPERVDRGDRERWLFASVGQWRRWSRHVTLQPFYFALVQRGREEDTVDRDIHTGGLRAYGLVGDTGVDYDVQGIAQWGRHGAQRHLAFAATGEVGYTAPLPTRPRVAAFYGHASGDANPRDEMNNRFERLFGFARPWSSNDYFQMENVSNPKVILELSPTKALRIDTAWAAYWLASDTDRWNVAGVRDETGRSGSFVGQEVNARVRYRLSDRIDANLGYAWFRPGEFARSLRHTGDSHFFYIELSVSALR